MLKKYASVRPSCGANCGEHILGKEKAKPVAKDAKRENRKRKKSKMNTAARKARRINDGSRKPLAYTGPHIEEDFDGWLESSKKYQ